MKNLKEILTIVKQNKFIDDPIKDLSIDRNGETVLSKLYTGLNDETYASDKDAILDIYGESDNTEKFRVFKWLLKESLLNKLVSIKIEKGDQPEYIVALHECDKKLFIMRILFRFRAYQAAVQIAKHTLEKSLKYSFTSIAYECARILREYYQINGDKRAFEEYALKARQMVATMAAENSAEEIYQVMAVRVAKRGAPSEQELGDWENELATLHKLYARHSTSMIIFLALQRTKSLVGQVLKDPAAVIQAGDEAIQYFRVHNHLARSFRFVEFLTLKLHAYLQQGDYANARFTAQLCLRHVKEHTNAWFVYKLQCFSLSMYLEDFVSASSILKAIRRQTHFDAQPDSIKEAWQVFDAYALFASMYHEYEPTAEELQRIHTLIHAAPNARRDKHGWNISLLIIQIMMHIYDGDLDQLEDRSESLNVYASKYLNRPETHRSRIFLRMLMLISKESGDRKRIEKLGEKWLRKLEGGAQKRDECEVIPYERLWEWTLHLLGKTQSTSDAYIHTRRVG